MSSLRIDQLRGPADLALVAAVHGEEDATVEAVETLLDDDPRMAAPVDVVVANEAAYVAGRRGYR